MSGIAGVFGRALDDSERAALLAQLSMRGGDVSLMRRVLLNVTS